MSESIDVRIAVLGLGHVGLPTALGLADLGWRVVGADDDSAKVEGICRGIDRDGRLLLEGLDGSLQHVVSQVGQSA